MGEKIFRRSYFVDAFFVVPFIALVVVGSYKIYTGVVIYDYLQVDKIFYGFLLILISLFVLLFTVREVFIQVSNERLIVLNLFKKKVQEVNLKKVKSKYLHEVKTKGVTVRELVFYDGINSKFVSLFGHSYNDYEISNFIERIENDEKLNKKFFTRDIKILAWVLLVASFTILGMILLNTYNENEYVEGQRTQSSNIERYEVEICGLSKNTKKNSRRIEKIKFEYCHDLRFIFIFKPGSSSSNDLNHLYDTLDKRASTKVFVTVNKELFDRKINNIMTEMSFKEKHLSFDVIDVYTLEVGGRIYKKNS